MEFDGLDGPHAKDKSKGVKKGIICTNGPMKLYGEWVERDFGIKMEVREILELITVETAWAPKMY